MELVTRFFRPPAGSFFLFGPRGTGKSFWLHQAFPDAVRIDLLEPEVFRAYSARPERLREIVEAQPKVTDIIVDEVQKVPEILSVVHALIEEQRPRRFILTGSSARKLKRAGTDLLAGRAILRTMHPYMAAELGERFSLHSAVHKGLLPLALAAQKPEEVLRTYAALYMKEEVQLEGLVRHIGGFSRFLEAISFSHGSGLNLSNVARECGVERKTVEGYVSVLEDLLLSFRVPVFTRRAQRALVAHDKFYYFDAGVFRSLRPAGPLDQTDSIDGPALEGLVAQHLRAWIGYRAAENQLYYWRTRSGVEVDFVVYGEGGLWAIEVKNTARWHDKDLTTLRAFQADYPTAKCLFLSQARERRKIGSTLCLPCEDFLRQLRPQAAIFDV